MINALFHIIALKTKTKILAQENPFRRRICEVFAEDRSAALNFDQFLDMYSVFSEAAPREIKVVYAFKIYGKILEHETNE